MRSESANGRETTNKLRWLLDRYGSGILLIGFSLYYFADVLLRASEKYFWYDELVTVYLCRLPRLQDIHEAVLHATDFNPPLFYVITRFVQGLFGEGQISTRIPEMLGFWILCISLFIFVNRRAGKLAGLMAMVLPMLTQAYYYAYEARPHGIVLGFAGLALVCWQKQLEGQRRAFWLACLSLCLFAAFMNHCYALILVAPFYLAELVRAIQSRRIRLDVWVALTAPCVIAVLVFVPLLRSYKAGVAGTQFGVTYFEPSWWGSMGFFLGLLSACVPVLLVLFVLSVVDRVGVRREDDSQLRERIAISSEELVVACGFLALPFFGVLAGKIVHGPFIPRYFMATVIGFAVLASLAAAGGDARSRTRFILAGLIIALLVKNSSTLVWHRIHGVGERLYEAGTGILLETTPGQPLKHFALLVKNAQDSRPVAILWTLDFLYLTYYAPNLLPHLYYVSCSEDPESIRAIHVVREWTRGTYHRENTCGEFISEHSDFLVYGYMGAEPLKMIQLGAELKSMKMDIFSGKFLSEMKGNSAALATERALPPVSLIPEQ